MGEMIFFPEQKKRVKHEIGRSREEVTILYRFKGGGTFKCVIYIIYICFMFMFTSIWGEDEPF